MKEQRAGLISKLIKLVEQKERGKVSDKDYSDQFDSIVNMINAGARGLKKIIPNPGKRGRTKNIPQNPDEFE
ncbi:MAG TPA: hypothetical protein VL401_02025 [Alphaproteobacteria bacterium]|jgi:hypothetical protein|nr:hypothetical protein [Alphaproteobacteria bacterium]